MDKSGLIHLLARLETSGLIKLAQTLPELEYLFRHALVQDAAYASLTKQDRRRLHLVIGETIEQTYPERMDELAGLLAHHFALAGEAHKAIDYSRRAARRAIERYAYDEGVQHLLTAIELAGEPNLHNFRAALLEELGDAYRLLRKGAAAIEVYQAALELLGDSTASMELSGQQLHRKIVQTIAELKWMIGRDQFDALNQVRLASRERLLAWLQKADQASAQVDTVRMLRTLSLDAWRVQSPSDWEAAVNYARRAVELADDLRILNEQSATRGMLATAYFGMGELQLYLDTALERLRITQEPEFEHLGERLDSLGLAGGALMYLGEYQKALTYLREAEELAVRVNAVDQHFTSLSLQQLCYFHLDDWDQALNAEQRWRALMHRFSREQTGPTCFPTALSACIHARRGELEQAGALQEEALKIMMAVSGGTERWLGNQFY